MIKEQAPADMREARCHQLGNLANRTPGTQAPDVRQWVAIEKALAGGAGHPRRRQLLWAVPGFAVLGLALWGASGLTLGHTERDCVLTGDGTLSMEKDRQGVVAFDDGTRITLGQGLQGQMLALGFRRGARLTLKSGHTDLTVVHRWIGRWEVLAGPFEVRVTGTRLGVDWASEEGHLRVGVSQGEVQVQGGPLRGPTAVRAGQRLDVDLASGRVILGSLGVPSSPDSMVVVDPPASEESRDKTVPKLGRVAPSVPHAERRRVAPSGKAAIRTPSTVASREESMVLPEAPFRDWKAARAADEEPGPVRGRLTVAADGKLSGGPTGPLWVDRGSGTKFLPPVELAPTHLAFEDGSLCTHGRISALVCVDEFNSPRQCNWDANWGMLIGWYPRSDREAWGRQASAGIAIEFRGKSGLYRLLAHRQGDPSNRVYCVQDYQSGRTVMPAQFRADCWAPGGSPLLDFKKVDSFALQLVSEETPLAFGVCLSAISLK